MSRGKNEDHACVVWDQVKGRVVMSGSIGHDGEPDEELVKYVEKSIGLHIIRLSLGTILKLLENAEQQVEDDLLNGR